MSAAPLVTHELSYVDVMVSSGHSICVVGLPFLRPSARRSRACIALVHAQADADHVKECLLVLVKVARQQSVRRACAACVHSADPTRAPPKRSCSWDTLSGVLVLAACCMSGGVVYVVYRLLSCVKYVVCTASTARVSESTHMQRLHRQRGRCWRRR